MIYIHLIDLIKTKILLEVVLDLIEEHILIKLIINNLHLVLKKIHF
jgi:hypothetical protein